LLSFLGTVWHLTAGALVWCVVIYSIFFDHKKRKSQAAYRRERAAYLAEASAQRYAAKPPVFRVIDQEKRFKKARRSAVAAIRWALMDGGFNQTEIEGSVVRVLQNNRGLVFDHDAFRRECLAVLNRATCEPQ
jgi:hypothetical protein